MPSLQRVSGEGRSVANILSQAKAAMLPEEIEGNSLAQWVMSYDALHREERQFDREFGEHLGRESLENSREEWSSQAARYITACILQARMPFYFASLFHIGRQWIVMETALDECSRLRQSERNLRASSRNLVQELLNQKLEGLDEATALQFIMEVCEAAIRQHTVNLDLARRWWRDWQREVRNFRNNVDFVLGYTRGKSDEERKGSWVQAAQQLLSLTTRPSSLQQSMEKHGVQFKPEVERQSQLLNTAFLFMTLANAITLENTSQRENLRLIEQLIDELRAIRLTNPALSVLKEKYGTQDPFAKYSVGRHAADKNLLDLINEHTLYGGEDSPWLETWKKSLPPESRSFSSTRFLEKALDSDDLSKRVFDFADATIKRSLASTYKYEQHPLESWDAYIQRIFEKELVESFAIMLFKLKTEEKTPTPQWSVEEFHYFIAGVVENLNQIGYKLRAPATMRLIVLWDRLKNGQNLYYSDDAW